MLTGTPLTEVAKSVPWSRLKPRRKYWFALPSPECCVTSGPAQRLSNRACDGTAAMGHTVLIVDDEPTLARNLAVYLERLGYDVRVSPSAEEGLQQFNEFRPEVVLLDHGLPGIPGLEALQRMLRLEPQTR